MRDIGPLSGGFIPAEETDDKEKKGQKYGSADKIVCSTSLVT